MRPLHTALAALVGLAALAAAPTAAAQTPCNSDSFEPNDTCATASPILSGSYPGMSVQGHAALGGFKLDYYELTLQPGEELAVDIAWNTDDAQLQLWLYDDGVCTTGFVDADIQGFGTADVSYNNISAVAETLVLKVNIYGPGVTCVDYDMNVTIAANPCVTAVDDLFEDNDDCTTPAVLMPGTTSGLAIFGANSTQGLDEDYWVVQNVPDGYILTVEMDYDHSNGDLAMSLYDAACAASAVKYSNYQTGLETIEYTNTTGAAADYWVHVQAFDQSYDCGQYDLTVTMVPDPCNSIPDDAFAPNSACSNAALLSPGTYTGLVTYHTVGDWFRVDVAPNKRIEVEALFSHAGGNIDLELYDGQCGTPIDTSTSWTDNEIAAGTNPTINTISYYILVELPYDIPNCNVYDLVIDVFDDPCLSTADDVYFPNFTCGQGPELAPGLHPDLFIAEYANDYYDIRLAPGATVDIRIECISSAGNVRGYLYDPQLSSCDGFSHVAVPDGFGDVKTITYTNPDPVERVFELEIFLDQFGDSECNTYSLLITGASGQAATPMCLGDGNDGFCPCGNNSAIGAGEGCVNSQGHGAVLTALGTNVVANDDMVFAITQGRPDQPSLLVQGGSTIAVPFKDGILCMGNPTERLEVVFLNGRGNGVTTSSTVTEGGAVPGMTLYYQAWYRDPAISPCGVGSNFTQGLAVQWL